MKKNIDKTKDISIKSKRAKDNFLYVLIMGAIFAVGISILYIQYGYTLELNKQNDAVLLNIEEEKKNAEKISKQEEYRNSDEYVEEIARERLSLVKPNEILFVDINK